MPGANIRPGGNRAATSPSKAAFWQLLGCDDLSVGKAFNLAPRRDLEGATGPLADGARPWLSYDGLALSESQTTVRLSYGRPRKHGVNNIFTPSCGVCAFRSGDPVGPMGKPQQQTFTPCWR